MTRFLRTANCGLINVDRIERIDEGERKGLRWQARATLQEGGHATLALDIDAIGQALLPVVAAAPGYVLLRYWASGGDDGGAFVDRLPVVAWRVDEGMAIPVTPEDVSQDNTLTSGVLLPDGRVIQPMAQTFDNEAAWRAEMDQQAKAERKPKLVERMSVDG